MPFEALEMICLVLWRLGSSIRRRARSGDKHHEDADIRRVHAADAAGLAEIHGAKLVSGFQRAFAPQAR